MMEKHDRFMDIIRRLNEMDGRSEHYYQTPEGTIYVWWGSGRWEHRWIELEQWSPTEEPSASSLVNYANEEPTYKNEGEIPTKEIKPVATRQVFGNVTVGRRVKHKVSGNLGTITGYRDPFVEIQWDGREELIEHSCADVEYIYPTEDISCETCAFPHIPMEGSRPPECDGCENAQSLINWLPWKPLIEPPWETTICDHKMLPERCPECSESIIKESNKFNPKTNTKYGIRQAGSKDHDTNIRGKWKKDRFPKEPNRPQDSIEDPNHPGSWINPDRGKTIPSELIPSYSNFERCPKCGMPYDPKPGVIMLNCIECGADMLKSPIEDPEEGHRMTEPDILNCPDREVLDEENIICNGIDGKPDSYDCPRLIAEDRCPRGYKQDNRARPNWLWDEDAEYERGYIGRAGVLSLRTYIEHLEQIRDWQEQTIDRLNETNKHLEAEIERLKAGAMDCAYCGKSFVPPHDGYIYCSGDCRKTDTEHIRMDKSSTKDLGRDDE